MITDIARNAIIAQGLIPDEDVEIGVILNPDWGGAPKIVLNTNPAKPEGETQFGVAGVTTPLAINCVAETRQEAWDIVRQAALAVYQHFTALEIQPNSGIFCITMDEHNVFPIPDRTTFQAFVAFNILHRPTLS